MFLSQLCNFVYIWCEAPVSEYVLNSCNNFYLKTSLYHFRPQAIQDSHPDSSSQAPANNLPLTGASTSCQRGAKGRGTRTGTSCRSEAQKNAHHSKKMSCCFTCRLQEMQILIHFSLYQMMTQMTTPVVAPRWMWRLQIRRPQYRLMIWLTTWLMKTITTQHNVSGALLVFTLNVKAKNMS